MAAMSAGSPIRRSGVRSRMRAIIAGSWLRIMSVRSTPGAMVLTRMFFGPHCRARWFSAALDTA